MISRRAARVRHALGQGHARHRVRPEGPPRAPQPRQHARQLREGRDARRSSGRRRPAARSGRPRSRASSPTPRSRACCRRCSSVDEVREYAAASDLPLTADEHARLDDAVGAQLRPRRPLRHAAEVERLTPATPRMRLPADQRRQQLLEVARERFARSGLPRDVDGRDRGGGRRHQARALPALPEQARALRRAARRHRPAAARPRSPRRRPRRRRGRERVEARLPRVLPVRGRRPLGVPPAVRHVDPHRSRVRAHRRRDRSTRRPTTISTLIEIPASDEQRRVLANALVGMAESVGRQALATRRRRRRRRSSRGGSSELAWFGLRGVRADDSRDRRSRR